MLALPHVIVDGSFFVYEHHNIYNELGRFRGSSSEGTSGSTRLQFCDEVHDRLPPPSILNGLPCVSGNSPDAFSLSKL
jgi:hypothetical protein